uniref:Uncharacterized protein n=1 Tax=Strongyloides venezuelensis TaxID=75913 RepID=A0A0K0G687_STRVS
MDLVSLSDQFKFPILKELDRENLNNLKLVYKDLFFTVVKNTEKLDRPKVEFGDDREYEIFVKDKTITEIKSLSLKTSQVVK